MIQFWLYNVDWESLGSDHDISVPSIASYIFVYRGS